MTRSAPLYTPVCLPCCLTPFLPLPHRHSQVTDPLTQEQGHPKSSVTGFQNKGENRVRTLVHILQLLSKHFCFPSPSKAQPLCSIPTPQSQEQLQQLQTLQGSQG